MSAFREALAAQQRDLDPSGRRTWFVPYDQLSGDLGALAREPARELAIVLVESPAKAARRPYHKQKLALVLANTRHFAIEQARRGVVVRHVVSAGGYADAVESVVADLGAPVSVMRPAERELRHELAPLVASGRVLESPHEGWLTEPDDFHASQGRRPPWRMEAFYRYVRQKTGILMDARNRPLGGKMSFDTDNRKAWKGEPPAPALPSFRSDPIKEEVLALVAERFAHHPGQLDALALPVTHADAEATWRWARSACLPTFGPYEDAMSTASRSLFHTRISPLLNLHRLLPSRVVREAAALEDVPLASREGFVRQILGWREFVRHVHEATDGFRAMPDGEPVAVAERPGDGGYARWRGEPWPAKGAGGDGGSTVSALGASADVPPAFWGDRSGLRCLDEVVTSVWDEAYSHHITRLMVLSNLATLLDVSPRALADWFWVAYADAYDWVVEPNVMAMGTFGTGELMTTKPYVAGSAYIHKMSDYCDGCRFDPRTTCPLPSMYWAYLGRHRDALADVIRVRLPLAAEAKRTAAQKQHDRAVFERVQAALLRGEELEPGV